MPDLMIVVSQGGRGTVKQRCQPGLAVHQRQSSHVLAVQVQQVEEEEDQRSLTSISRVLDKVECRRTIRAHAAKFAVKIGAPHREPSNRLGDGGVVLCPVASRLWAEGRGNRCLGATNECRRNRRNTEPVLRG